INFLFISRVMKEKGIDIYLEAAQSIKATHPNTTFHILGYCEDNAYLSKISELESKGIVKYHGMQDDIRKYHEISHWTIHSSYYPEGMSNVLLESAASGRPIITTKRSGCREIVQENYNGYLIDTKDAHQLIDKIQEFLSLNNDEKKQFGLNGRTKIEN